MAELSTITNSNNKTTILLDEYKQRHQQSLIATRHPLNSNNKDGGLGLQQPFYYLDLNSDIKYC
jgi:hypothetical protein